MLSQLQTPIGDLGYLNGITGATPRSSYYHEQLMASYLKGRLIASSTTQPFVKSVATRDASTIAVAVFYMDRSQNYQAVIRFDNTTSATGTLGIRVDAGLNREQTDQIDPRQTVVYQFSPSGTLLKRCRYSLPDYRAGNAPTCTVLAGETVRSGLWSDAGTWSGGVAGCRPGSNYQYGPHRHTHDRHRYHPESHRAGWYPSVQCGWPVAGAFRRSELVALNMEGVQFTRDGAVLTYQGSKTNQYGKTEQKALFFSPDPDTCPVRALQDYISLLGRQTGPLFVFAKESRLLMPGYQTSRWPE